MGQNMASKSAVDMKTMGWKFELEGIQLRCNSRYRALHSIKYLT